MAASNSNTGVVVWEWSENKKHWIPYRSDVSNFIENKFIFWSRAAHSNSPAVHLKEVDYELGHIVLDLSTNSACSAKSGVYNANNIQTHILVCFIYRNFKSWWNINTWLVPMTPKRCWYQMNALRWLPIDLCRLRYAAITTSTGLSIPWCCPSTVRINTQKTAKDDEIRRKTVKTHERRLKTVENQRKTPKTAKIRWWSPSPTQLLVLSITP